MGNGTKGTSLLEQNAELKKKWGGDTLNYDIQGAIKEYDANLAKYNNVSTSQAEKDKINAMYGGDITKWDNKNAYANYMNDYNFIQSVDSLNNAYTGAVDKARQDESRAMQYADTRRQLMQKYLPETLMAQGVANTGYTADALLKSENNYNQYVLGAMNERAETEQNAMQAYQTALSDYKQQASEKAYADFLNKQSNDNAFYSSAITLIDEGYDVDYVREQAELQGVSDDGIAKLEQYIENKKVIDQEKLYELYKSNLNGVSSGELRSARKEGLLTTEQYVDLFTQRNALNERNKAYSTKATYLKNLGNIDEEDDTYKIMYRGDEYRVDNAGKITDENIVNFAKANVEEKSVFAYRDKLYLKWDNETVLLIKGHGTGTSYSYLKEEIERYAGN